MRKWLDSFHTAELDALEYDRWEFRLHGEQARLNLPWFTALVHLALVVPGVVDAAMPREDRKTRERLPAEEVDVPYKPNLCREHSELTEAERDIFAEHGKVIFISNIDIKRSDISNKEEEEFYVEEWRWIFRNGGTSPDPCLYGGALSRQDWLSNTSINTVKV
ncbi:Bifunctional dihydroflavonol 4-reductase/flavanone 4-reductase [Hordeum vulgare]|nr:Bifunctional dihydroflavonol 4-reductase/flavanone 4-reductase [Hordeum vulgare]